MNMNECIIYMLSTLVKVLVQKNRNFDNFFSKSVGLLDNSIGLLQLKLIRPLWKNLEKCATGGVQICKCACFLCDF